MALTEAQKRKIEEEEAYRAKIREESHAQTSKKRGSGCLIALLIVIAVPILMLIAINPAKQFERAEEKPLLSANGPVPANEIADKTEDEIRTTYASVYRNYSDTGLTPSGKVKITGFDITNANVQIDYEVATSRPVYIGYSFAANPLAEGTAWEVTGVSKPFAEPTSNPGVMNRTVYVWENTAEIEPYKMIQAIYEADGNVAKIAFSMEDLATAQSHRSLYYVR